LQAELATNFMNGNPNNLRNIVIWIIVGLLVLALVNLLTPGSQRASNVDPISISQVYTLADQGKITDVKIAGDKITGKFVDGGREFLATGNKEGMGDFGKYLYDKKVKFEYVADDSETPTLISVLINWFPMLLLVGVWVFFMRQMQGGGGKAMGFGKSRAKLLTERHGRVTFDDVAGIDEAKEDLQEIVEFLRDPQKFQRLGGKIPKGALLIGPPGTGKTLLARAIAGEANVPFFTISGSDFVEMFVGVGASRVRDMFDQAKKNAPCIIFIDEIDAVGRHRGAGLGGGNDEREQTLNQLLVEMDGFETNEGVILIAATNRPDVLDPALLRPGRFDRQIHVPNPDIVGREKILKVHMKKVPMAPDVNPNTIARGTPGFSGADLANLVNEAALLAARRNKRMVTQREFEEAKDKVMMGAERKSMVMSEEEKRLTAYHEGGHALVAMSVPASDPVHKATIIPRGRALGMVMQLPEADKLSFSREQMHSRMAIMMGGRVAEEIIFGHDKVTSGASSDIDHATRLARAMVTRWGMSEKLGPLAYSADQEEVFLGHSVSRTQNVSPATAEMIDDEIRRFVDEGYQKARQILTDRLEDLHKIGKALLEFETLSGDEIKALLRGEAIVREAPEDTSAPKAPSSSVPSAGRPRGSDSGIAPEPQPT
jgi:cell division protease FtsH